MCTRLPTNALYYNWKNSHLNGTKNNRAKISKDYVTGDKDDRNAPL